MTHAPQASLAGSASHADLPAGLPGTAPFAVVADLQDTLLAERLLLRRERNPAERARLLAHLAARRPAFLVIAGDLTSAGWSARAWRRFDAVMDGLRRERVPVLPIMGNHDYGMFPRRARRRFAERFPPLAGARWYARTYGRLAMLFLDANAAVLPPDAWRRQAEWFSAALAAYDADPAIGGVLVFAHQPPYTNSTVTRDDAAVQRALVPPFVRSRKAVAMISGHTHAYEHFVREGKHFLVAGGGGGPRVRLLEGDRRRHADLFAGPSPRPFHYVWLAPGAGGIDVTVHGFDKGAADVAVIDRFDLSYR